MVHNSPLYTIILAAGKGTRMKSDRAKVLHEVFYAPMLHHVLDAVMPLQPTKSIVIIGHQRDAVKKSLRGYQVDFAIQEEQLGTGHAVLCAESAIDSRDGCVMILCGDTPLIRQETLRAMLTSHRSNQSVLTVMTTILDDPSHYGRIVSSETGSILAIVEEKDADSKQKMIREINAGIYCIDTSFLYTHLKKIGCNNSQGEVYLTDIVTLAVTEGINVQKFVHPSPQDVLGVNSRLELSQAHHELQLRRNRGLMASGVSMISPETIQIAPTVSLEQDITLHPGVEITGHSHLGSGCTIKNGALLHNVQLGRDTVVGAYSCLADCNPPAAAILAPYSRFC